MKVKIRHGFIFGEYTSWTNLDYVTRIQLGKFEHHVNPEELNDIRAYAIDGSYTILMIGTNEECEKELNELFEI